MSWDWFSKHCKCTDVLGQISSSKKPFRTMQCLKMVIHKGLPLWALLNFWLGRVSWLTQGRLFTWSCLLVEVFHAPLQPSWLAELCLWLQEGREGIMNYLQMSAHSLLWESGVALAAEEPRLASPDWVASEPAPGDGWERGDTFDRNQPLVVSESGHSSLINY